MPWRHSEINLYGDRGNRCDLFIQQRYYNLHLHSKTNLAAGRATPLAMYDWLYTCIDCVIRKDVLEVIGRGKLHSCRLVRTDLQGFSKATQQNLPYTQASSVRNTNAQLPQCEVKVLTHSKCHFRIWGSLCMSVLLCCSVLSVFRCRQRNLAIGWYRVQGETCKVSKWCIESKLMLNCNMSWQLNTTYVTALTLTSRPLSISC